MRPLAAFIMAGRLQAVTVTVGFALLSLFLPPLALLSGAAVGLVALRAGTAQGLIVLALGGLALTLLVFPLTGQPLTGASYALTQWLPVVVLASVLRQTTSWSLTLQAAVLLGVLAVLGAHLIVPDLVAIWLELLNQLVRPVFEQSGMAAAEIDQLLAVSASVMTGVVGGFTVLGIILTLLVARVWQAMLYNPGGFRQEFHGLRVGKWPALATLALLLVAAVVQSAVLAELAIVMLGVFFLQGVAVVHGLVGKLNWHMGALVAMYVALVLLFLHVAALLTGLGVIDNFADFRNRIGGDRQQGE